MKQSKRKNRRKKRAADQKPKPIEMPKNMEKEYYWVLELIKILKRHGGWDQLLCRLDYSKRLTAKQELHAERARARVLVKLLERLDKHQKYKFREILRIANSIKLPAYWLNADSFMKIHGYTVGNLKFVSTNPKARARPNPPKKDTTYRS